MGLSRFLYGLYVGADDVSLTQHTDEEIRAVRTTEQDVQAEEKETRAHANCFSLHDPHFHTYVFSLSVELFLLLFCFSNSTILSVSNLTHG